MKAAAVHKDLRTPKYKMLVVRNLKGKGSFKRVKQISNHDAE